MGPTGAPETACVVALLQNAGQNRQHYSELIEQTGSARAILEAEHGLLVDELLQAASVAIASWGQAGIDLLSVLDDAYPENLRGVHERPPLIFVRGRLLAADARSVAVIGSRQASGAGIAVAREIAGNLVDAGYTVISGLARGIDATAHSAALDRRGRTVAVVGTGLNHCYPRQHAQLQSRISELGAVVSQFWPDTPPDRGNFPMRNAVMSGMSLANVIVEAGPTSGARTQARLALAHGRPVLLMARLLNQDWARELAARPGVHVLGAPPEVVPLVDHLASADLLG